MEVVSFFLLWLIAFQQMFLAKTLVEHSSNNEPPIGSGLNQTENSTQSKPVSTEVDDRHEGKHVFE